MQRCRGKEGTHHRHAGPDQDHDDDSQDVRRVLAQSQALHISESEEKKGAKDPRASEQPDNPDGANERRVRGELEEHCSDAGPPENLSRASRVEQGIADSSAEKNGRRRSEEGAWEVCVLGAMHLESASPLRRDT